jgi:hypothetical protein
VIRPAVPEVAIAVPTMDPVSAWRRKPHLRNSSRGVKIL